MQAIESNVGTKTNLKSDGIGIVEMTPKPSNFLGQVTGRCTGPGGFYNIGNVIALLTGLLAQQTSSANHRNLTEVIGQYLFGSPAASCLTLSMIIFIAAGEAYHRSSMATDHDCIRLNRIGDFLSGVAAIFLTIALVNFGEAQLALVAGSMLALGKFGTAVIPEGVGQPNVSKSFRLLVIASRFPSLLALGITLTGIIDGRATEGDTLVALAMFGCYSLWLWADVLLLRKANS